VSPPRRDAWVVRWTMSDCRDQLEFSTSVVHTVLFASTLPGVPRLLPDLRSYMRHANVNEILPTCSRRSCTSELSSSRGRAKVIITSHENRNLTAVLPARLTRYTASVPRPRPESGNRPSVHAYDAWGCPPRHVCAACWHVLLTYLLTCGQRAEKCVLTTLCSSLMF
jgi:hypothetical protein